MSDSLPMCLRQSQYLQSACMCLSFQNIQFPHPQESPNVPRAHSCHASSIHRPLHGAVQNCPLPGYPIGELFKTPEFLVLNTAIIFSWEIIMKVVSRCLPSCHILAYTSAAHSGTDAVSSRPLWVRRCCIHHIWLPSISLACRPMQFPRVWRLEP